MLVVALQLVSSDAFEKVLVDGLHTRYQKSDRSTSTDWGLGSETLMTGVTIQVRMHAALACTSEVHVG